MSHPLNLLLVDPDDHARAQLGTQLDSLDVIVHSAADGPAARAVLDAVDVRLMVSELYLPANGARCLIAESRRLDPERDLRIVAHTHRSLGDDRDWALRAGADAYLIKPTRATRVRYVVGRLLAAPAASMAATPGQLVRRDSLDVALTDIEHGRLDQSACIVFGRTWWQALSSNERMEYRGRAKAARVSLRSDSAISAHYVEVRGRYRPDLGLSTEQPESPYRR